MKPRRFFEPFFLIPIAAIFLFSLFVMLLWNGVITQVTSASVITYWQAMGILVLSKILFGFRGPGGRPGWGNRHGRGGCGQKMSPEEREKVRSYFRNRRTDAAEFNNTTTTEEQQ